MPLQSGHGLCEDEILGNARCCRQLPLEPPRLEAAAAKASGDQPPRRPFLRAARWWCRGGSSLGLSAYGTLNRSHVFYGNVIWSGAGANSRHRFRALERRRRLFRYSCTPRLSCQLAARARLYNKLPLRQVSPNSARSRGYACLPVSVTARGFSVGNYLDWRGDLRGDLHRGDLSSRPVLNEGEWSASRRQNEKAARLVPSGLELDVTQEVSCPR